MFQAWSISRNFDGLISWGLRGNKGGECIYLYFKVYTVFMQSPEVVVTGLTGL